MPIITLKGIPTAPVRAEAIQGQVFVIDSVLWTVESPENDGSYALFDRWIDEKSNFDDAFEKASLISMFNMQSSTTVVKNLFHGIPSLVRTRYMTLLPDNDTATARPFCLISYHFDKATRDELIWEWFSKFR